MAQSTTKTVSLPATQPLANGEPVALENTHQFDLLSKLDGQVYRLMVYVPPKLDLAKPQAVVYLMDGNFYFATACNAMPMNQLNGIVVAIGYPLVDRNEVIRRRTFDLSLASPTNSKKYGGGDTFLQIIQQEVKPYIAARYKIDPARQCLFGHSLGGLMVLRQLFKNPADYSTYLAASPSIWWNDRILLKDEDAFSKQIQSGDLHVKLLLTSAGDEQYRGDDAKRLNNAEKYRMVDNVSDLASRLSALHSENLTINREIFPDETHTSGSFSALCRSLRFALPAFE